MMTTGQMLRKPIPHKSPQQELRLKTVASGSDRTVFGNKKESALQAPSVHREDPATTERDTLVRLWMQS
jgi:hypothetical protein